MCLKSQEKHMGLNFHCYFFLDFFLSHLGKRKEVGGMNTFFLHPPFSLYKTAPE